MKEFDCPKAGITVSRGVVEAFVMAFGAYRSRGEQAVMRHLGLPVVPSDPDYRFPLVEFLSAMAELQTQFGAPFMRKIGSYIFDKAAFPPGIDTLVKGMELVNTAYYMNHSAEAVGLIGGYHWKGEEGRRGTMMLDNPYPCAFDLGIIETIARRFEPTAQVEHLPGACRHAGDAECRVTVTW